MTDPAPSASPIAWQQAVVSEIVAATPRIKSFRLTLTHPFAFVAGQHVDVRLTAPDGYRAMRSYSIASAPEDPALELAIERLDDGEVSPFFHDVVAVGDEIELRGPLGGHFIWPAATRGPLLLVGGGSGVVPLVSMIRHRSATADRRDVILLYSARTASDLIYYDELIAAQERRDGFTLVVTLTREAPLRPGDYGRRIDAAMMTAVLGHFASAPERVFVCGTNGFVNAAADGAVAAGIPASHILTERYGA